MISSKEWHIMHTAVAFLALVFWLVALFAGALLAAWSAWKQ